MSKKTKLWVTQQSDEWFGFSCPDCGEDLIVNIDSWGDAGYAPRGWDPGDPGESPSYTWPHGFIGCPHSFDAETVEELCTFWPGSGRWPDFHQLVDEAADAAQEERLRDMAEYVAEAQAEDRYDRSRGW